MTYKPDVLDAPSSYPVPHHLLPPQLLDSNQTLSSNSSDTAAIRRTAKDLAPYAMSDLTIPSYIHLARRLGKASGKNKRLWKRFTTYMYMRL